MAQRRLETEPAPVRTNDELYEDLRAAVAGSDSLLRDERVRRWFRWEMRLVKSTASSLLPAPTRQSE